MMVMLRSIVLLAFSIGVLLSSCKPRTSYVISEKEAQAAAKELEAIVQSGNKEQFAAFFDMPSLLAILAEKTRTAKDPDLIMKDARANYSIMPVIEKALKSTEGGSGRLIRNYEKNGRRHLLFRFLSTGGITYMDFHLIKVENLIKAEDVLGFLTGEELTTTLADGLNKAGTKDDYMKVHKEQYKAFKAMEARGDYQGIRNLYEQLPAVMQKDKHVLIVYTNACMNTGAKEYKIAVEEQLSANPYANMLMIGVYVWTKEYDKALVTIDKLNEIIGGNGDPYLDYYKGYTHMLMGNRATAKVYYEKVAAYDPDLLDNLQALIALYVEDKEIDKARKLVSGYRASKVFSQEGWDLLQKTYPQLLN